MLIQGVNSGVFFTAIRQLTMQRKFPKPAPGDIATMRAQSAEMNHFLTQQFGITSNVTHSDQSIETKNGQLRIRIYSPDRITSHSVLYYVHGGGFIFSSVGTYNARCSHWAANTGCTVISVDYRLAPEHPYPAALDDVMDGLAWTSQNLSKWNASKIAIVGDSAGGGLAAAAALRNRDEGKVDLAAQILVYPMIDDRNLGPDPRFTGPFIVWTFDNNTCGWNSYLGGQAGANNTSIYAAPARAQDLTGLPATYIDTGTKDIFLDEDIAYAKALRAAGVTVEAHVWNGAPHGFDYFAARTALGRKAWQARFDFVARHL